MPEAKCEAIAEWVGLEIVDIVESGLAGIKVEDGKLFYGKGGLRYAIPDGGGCKPWHPDNDITLWRGPDGLLAKIEEKGMLSEFTREVLVRDGITISVEADGSEWVLFEWIPRLLSIPPAQLTDALYAVIKED